MQFKKLTDEQRRIKRWRDRRNKIVCQLLAADPHLTREAALKLANDRMHRGR